MIRIQTTERGETGTRRRGVLARSVGSCALLLALACAGNPPADTEWFTIPLERGIAHLERTDTLLADRRWGEAEAEAGLGIRDLETAADRISRHGTVVAAGPYELGELSHKWVMNAWSVVQFDLALAHLRRAAALEAQVDLTCADRDLDLALYHRRRTKEEDVARLDNDIASAKSRTRLSMGAGRRGRSVCPAP